MNYDVLIIGCGVVGAVCAYELARYDLRVGVLEASNDVANGTTKANSAIVHAGYDPLPGTKMARLNVEGTALMGPLCARLDVPYRNNGSLVLSLSEEDDETLKTSTGGAWPTACPVWSCWTGPGPWPWSPIWLRSSGGRFTLPPRAS